MSRIAYTSRAWAAGIIDGEGCITISRQKGGAGGRVNPPSARFRKAAG